MIEGKIKNPFELIPNLENLARSQGATTLRIEGSLANERLFKALARSYKVVTEGARDIITIPLK
jgi:hypothetical protein